MRDQKAILTLKLVTEEPVELRDFVGAFTSLANEFVRRWGSRFTSLVKGKVPAGEIETVGELKDWADAARSIASDPIGSHRLTAAYFEDGKQHIKASFHFDASEARSALVHIEDLKKLLAAPEHVPHHRVLMTFTRSDINNANVNKSSGERVKIEEISQHSLSLMYGSETAESRIKHEIREADENVYKKGFVVDVFVKVKNGKPVAYSVHTVHDVLDLPE